MGRKRDGFTLVELTAAVSILAILLAVAVPQMMGYFKAAHRAAGRTEAQLLADAAQRYLDDRMEDGELSAKTLMKLMGQELNPPEGELKDYLRGGQDEAKIASLNVNMDTGLLLSVTYESKYYRVRVVVDRDGNRTLENEQLK